MQGIPAVKAFKDGKVADEFTGAIPPRQVEEFFDRLVPSEADARRRRGDPQRRRGGAPAGGRADPRNVVAATALARILMSRGDYDEAVAILDAVPQDFAAAGLARRAPGSRAGAGLDEAFTAWDKATTPRRSRSSRRHSPPRRTTRPATASAR